VARERQAATEAWFRAAKAHPLTSCIAENWDEDYAKSEFWSQQWEAGSKPESELAWPAGLRVDDGKLFVYDKLLIPESRMDQVIQEWHDQQLLHPGEEKMRVDMFQRFQFPPGFYKALKAVCGPCQVCQAVKPPNRSRA
jgi:hypothetical protein